MRERERERKITKWEKRNTIELGAINLLKGYTRDLYYFFLFLYFISWKISHYTMVTMMTEFDGEENDGEDCEDEDKGTIFLMFVVFFIGLC